MDEYIFHEIYKKVFDIVLKDFERKYNEYKKEINHICCNNAGFYCVQRDRCYWREFHELKYLKLKLNFSKIQYNDIILIPSVIRDLYNYKNGHDFNWCTRETRYDKLSRLLI